MSWPLVSLESISEFIRNGASIKQSKDAGGLPITRIETIAEREVNLEKCGYADVDDSEYQDYRLSNGDILISHINSEKHLGKCAIYECSRSDVIHGMNLLCLRPVKGKAFPRYLFHYLSSPEFGRLIPSITKKSVNQASFTVTAFKELEIPLPPLAEQKRIAAILDKADAIRRKREQAIQLADDFLRAVFLDMFGSSVDKREWKEVKFDEVALIDAKMVDPREAEYLDLLHIGPDRIEKNTGKLLPALTAREENLISKKFLFDQSYVLYSKIRPYLRKVALPDFVGLCSADMYPVRPKDGFLTREFLWQLLLSDDFTKYTETLPGRANIPKLNRNELNGYCFKLPPIDLQEKFSGIFRKQNQGYLSSRSAKEMSDSAFGALSQKAFSGQL